MIFDWRKAQKINLKRPFENDDSFMWGT
jgi:hypothetical protein